MPLLDPRTWTRATKRRAVFYPSLIGALAGAVAYCTVMPGNGRPTSAASRNEVLRGEQLKVDLQKLAGEIGERNVGQKPLALAQAAAWLGDELRASGYTVERQTWSEGGVPVENLWVDIPGATRPREQIVVGAHYDSAEGAPGANDNGTGVVLLLGLARELSRDRGQPWARTVRLVFFTNEEPPWFWTESMGSLRYARAAKARKDDVRAMISLETIGFFSKEPGSQRYPGIVRAFYPDEGDFVGFVAALPSRSLLRQSIGTFRETRAIASEGAALPGFVPGVGWSDHWAFAEVGYPALMITDTAVFRYPHYHTARDTPDKVDTLALARTHTGLREVIHALADAPP